MIEMPEDHWMLRFIRLTFRDFYPSTGNTCGIRGIFLVASAFMLVCLGLTFRLGYAIGVADVWLVQNILKMPLSYPHDSAEVGLGLLLQLGILTALLTALVAKFLKWVAQRRPRVAKVQKPRASTRKQVVRPMLRAWHDRLCLPVKIVKRE